MFLTVVQPFRALAIMMVAALWVDSLPSQVNPLLLQSSQPIY